MGGGLACDSMDAQLSRLIQLQHESLAARAANLQELKDRILSYRPGTWIEECGGYGFRDFAIPEVTTLIVVGPMGAGKSTLINNMIRVVNDMTYGFDRAQVCDDPSDNGTLFLREYMLCNNSKNVCIVDTRGFSEMDTDEDIRMLNKWMTNGVKHGDVVHRSSGLDADSVLVRARHGHHKRSVSRQVNFVIFVASAVAVHKEMIEGSRYSTLAKLYKCPSLTFKDDRPLVVMTHGDELSPEDRIAARIYLGKMLGVSALNQIFDIPGYTGRYMEKRNRDLVADMATLELLECALMRADRNLSYKEPALANAISQAVKACMSAKMDRSMMTLVWFLISWVAFMVLFGICHIRML